MKTQVQYVADGVWLVRNYPDTTVKVKVAPDLNSVLECSHPFELNHAYGSLIVKIPFSQNGRRVFSRDRWFRVRNFVNRAEWEKEVGIKA